MRQDEMSGYMEKRTVPETVAEDDDDVVVALETARVSEERDDLESAQKWLHRAAAAARRQGRPDRAGTLSRSAARIIGQPHRFERQPDPQLVLSDVDEEVENTIVETVEELARKSEPLASLPINSSDRGVSRRSLDVAGNRFGSKYAGAHELVEAATPLAALVERAEAHQALRVAVKKTMEGGFEARPLGPGETVSQGEQEALLVPIEGPARH